jgi:hypothetical protein
MSSAYTTKLAAQAKSELAQEIESLKNKVTSSPASYSQSSLKTLTDALTAKYSGAFTLICLPAFLLSVTHPSCSLHPVSRPELLGS